MTLFQGDTIKKIHKLLDNAEKRKEKLQKRVATLKEEAELLYQAVQDDFNQAILNDSEPSKKLSSDLEKVQDELKRTQFQLEQIDLVVQAELEKAKGAVDKERKEFVANKGEEFRKQFDKMNDLKLAYLESIIEYSKMKAEYDVEYRNTFRDIENRVGLRNRDIFYDFHISLNQRYQLDGDHYSPMVYNDELRDALQGKLSFVTEKNKDKFKKK